MYFPKERINETLKVLEKYRYVGAFRIDNIGFAEKTASEEEITFRKPLQEYTPFENGGAWNGKDICSLFRFDVELPEEFDQKPVMLLITTGREDGWEALNPQFIVWTENGLKQGIDVNHREILLDECVKCGKTYKVLLEGWSGLEAMSCTFQVEAMCINREVEALYYDLLVASDIVFMQKQEETNRVKMLEVLMPIVNSIYLYKVPSNEFYESIRAAHQSMVKEFFEYFSGNDITVYCTGHSHIDVAWRWEVRHSRKKAVRSFASAIDHMDQYPDFIFSSSQPQLYSFIKKDYPEFYDKIKEKMRQNNFEAEGAMWLEADCNLISGESFVRQLVHGKRFFKEEFGIDSKVLWLPDVFGYSAAMPQLLKLSGVDYFITSKISWNEYNRMPHDVFLWEGIDGSKVLTYLHTMPDENDVNTDSFFATYNGQIRPGTVAGTWNKFKDKELTKNVLASFGFGDGGGGPARKDLEYAKRLKLGMPGVPRVKYTKILPFMEKLKEEILSKPKVPKWCGELYLEFHRGTYTSIAGVKRYNRRCEIALHDLELTAVMAYLTTGSKNYPFKEIERMWEVVLLNQFHDIVPGSSIGPVYENSFKEYQEVLDTSESLKNSMLSELSDKKPDSASMTVYNLLPFNRSDIVIFDGHCKSLLMSDGMKQAVQKTFDNKNIAWITDIPSMGYLSVQRSNKEPDYPENQILYVNESRMENKFFIVEFDEAFQIASIYDKQEKREILTDKGNVLRVFEDRPREYDAWEITSYYRDKECIINDVSYCRVIEKGPIRAGIEVVRNFLSSVITQRIFIYQDLKRIDFDTEIEWNEKQLLLKAGFPLAVQNDFATFDIAFGNLRRPTHSNTSWDFAKFEVSAHKWADVSERGYGVALLNDCKYGYMVKDGMLELTLLKSASFPYEKADNGKHVICYSLYPHTGDFAEGKVEKQAWMLNSGLLPVNSASLAKSHSLFSTLQDNVFIDTIKLSYDGEGVIVRLHENEGRRTMTKLISCKVIKAACLCDLLENNLETLIFDLNEVPLVVKPYEIKTIKLLF